MSIFPGGYQRVPGVIAGLPHVELPDWNEWQNCYDEDLDDEIIDAVRQIVERDGWTLVGRRSESYVYSVGLSRRGWPEMVIRLTRATPKMACHLLGHLFDMQSVHSTVLVPGREWTLECGPHVQIKAIADEQALWLCEIASELFGNNEPIHAVEIVPA